MKYLPCWLPGEKHRRDVLAACAPDAAEAFGAATQLLRHEDDAVDVYVDIGDGRSELFRVAILGGDIVAALVGQRFPKVGAK